TAEEDSLGERRGEFEIHGEFARQHRPICSGFLCDSVRIVHNDAACKIAGAHRVVQSFAGDRIDEATRIADSEPAVACDSILSPPRSLQRREHVAVESRSLPGDTAIVHVALQPPAEGMGRFAFAANTDRKVSATRKYPNIALQIRQKLYI